MDSDPAWRVINEAATGFHVFRIEVMSFKVFASKFNFKSNLWGAGGWSGLKDLLNSLDKPYGRSLICPRFSCPKICPPKKLVFLSERSERWIIFRGKSLPWVILVFCPKFGNDFWANWARKWWALLNFFCQLLAYCNMPKLGQKSGYIYILPTGKNSFGHIYNKKLAYFYFAHGKKIFWARKSW